MMAVENTKNKISEILIDEIITTIGCSEEQSYENMIDVDIYVKLKHIDLFKILQVSFEDENGKFYYESETTPNGQIQSCSTKIETTRITNDRVGE